MGNGLEIIREDVIREATQARPAFAGFVRRPLIGLSLAFMGGTWLGAHTTHPPAFALPLAAATLLASLIVLRSHHAFFRWLSHILIFSCVFLTAFLNTTIRFPPPTPIALGKEPAVVRLLVTDEPTYRLMKNGRRALSFPAELQSDTAERKAGRPPSTTWGVRVTLIGEPAYRVPAYGDIVTVKGRLTPFKQRNATLPTRELNLYASARACRVVANGQGQPFVAWCLNLRAGCRSLLCAGLDSQPRLSAIINSLVLGYRGEVTRDEYDVFSRTGTLHVFAISGSHVAVLAVVFAFALRSFGVQRTRWFLYLTPMLCIYTLMTGLQPSAVRACIMGAIYWFAPLVGRRADIYTSLAAAAIVILIGAPFDLFNVGFILSFAVVLGMVVYFPIIATPLRTLFQPDPLRVQPERTIVRWLRSLWPDTVTLLSTSLSAWIISVPATAYFFTRFSPIAIPGNLIAVPMSSLLLICGIISVLAGTVSEQLAITINHANLAMAWFMTVSMQKLASIPGACFDGVVLPAWAAWLIYAVLGLVGFMLRQWLQERQQRKEPSLTGPMDTSPD